MGFSPGVDGWDAVRGGMPRMGEDSASRRTLTEGTIWAVGTVWCLLDAGAGRRILVRMKSKHLTLSERTAYRGLEDVVGCKWSAAVVGALQRGITRPGQLERYIPGISTKILNERLRKLLAYGLATRADHSATSLHVEYRLTHTGAKLAGVIEQLHTLQTEHSATLGASEAEPEKRVLRPSRNGLRRGQP